MNSYSHEKQRTARAAFLRPGLARTGPSCARCCTRPSAHHTIHARKSSFSHFISRPSLCGDFALLDVPCSLSLSSFFPSWLGVYRSQKGKLSCLGSATARKGGSWMRTLLKSGFSRYQKQPIIIGTVPKGSLHEGGCIGSVASITRR